jgi:hypothetical protein
MLIGRMVGRAEFSPHKSGDKLRCGPRSTTGQVKLQKNELSVVQLTSKVLITSWKCYDANQWRKYRMY